MFFGINMAHHLSGDLGTAAQSAAIEAANTGSAVLILESVEIGSIRVAFIGKVPAATALADKDARGLAASARAIYTTQSSFFLRKAP